MPKARAAQLEAGLGALGRARHEALRSREILQMRVRIEHFEHLLRIGFPIRRQPQESARLQPLDQERDEWRLNQAAFVMALLGPRIREENDDLIERP